MMPAYRDFTLSHGVKTGRLAVWREGDNLDVMVERDTLVKVRGDLVVISLRVDSQGNRTVTNNALKQIFPKDRVYLYRDKAKTFIWVNGASYPFKGTHLIQGGVL